MRLKPNKHISRTATKYGGDMSPKLTSICVCVRVCCVFVLTLRKKVKNRERKGYVEKERER
jgi:hypothetical protein